MSNFPSLTAAAVKKAAFEYGADIVGIGSIERWNSAPAGENPKTIMPRARSVICVGFRMHRGLHRGIEEGTYYSAYTLAGYTDLNQHIAPIVQRRLASFIEDSGYEATPVMYLSGRLGNNVGEPARYSDGTAKPKPDVFFNFRIAGELCGAGQVGYSRMFLTEKFGPAQRIYFIITDAVLEADPIAGGICDGCKECVRTCPAKALSGDKNDDVDSPGVTYIKRCALNNIKCVLAHSFGALSPFAPPEVKAYALNIINGTDTETADGKPVPTREEISGAILDKIGYAASAQSNFHGPAVLCAECVRSCLSHLEKRGRLTLKFHNQFRE
jgi:ferredoxin